MLPHVMRTLTVGRHKLVAVQCLLAIFVSLILFASPARAEKRLALVIGNANYMSVAGLKNSINDANDVAAKLRSLKFEVAVVLDAKRDAMLHALEDFRARISTRDIGLIYYAGHGIAINGESFLLPTDVAAEVALGDSETGSVTVRQPMVSMAALVSPLQAARLGIVILDACRNTPGRPELGLSVVTLPDSAVRRSVSIARGIAPSVVPVSSKGGIFRAYAAELGSDADDGTGRNSPFTTALLRHMATPLIPISELMIRVRKDVLRNTNNTQRPWEEGALNEAFYFVPAPPARAPRPSGASGASTSAKKVATAARWPSPSAARARGPVPLTTEPSKCGRREWCR